MPVFEDTTESSSSSSGRTGTNPSSHLQSIMSSSASYPITLKFMDLCYRVKLENRSGGCIHRMLTAGSTTSTASVQERIVLNGITGMASPGEILAILGPSGSGKSTLLNALAGRLHNHHGLTGTVLANDRKISKSIQKRTGFVAQDDVLYPHLTVRETLVFCSLLRLPKSLTRREKTGVAESVISELGLSKCADTIIGNSFVRGISGGERKRVSIGHEMLVNPGLLILDEPTSGLDSTAAFRLLTTLGSVARKGKTVVTSVHQPSSRVYQMFDSILVLSEGRCIFFGKGSDAMDYFHSTGFSPSFPMNPADFLLDLANGVCQFNSPSEREKPNVKQVLVSSYNTLLAAKVKTACMESLTTATTTTTTTTTTPKDNNSNAFKEPSIASTRWEIGVSTWFNQFSILLQRSLKERRHETFNSLRVFQVIAASLLAGSMWWHSDYRDVQDRLGLLFVISIFWGVFSSFNSAFAFPHERAIFMKERASGMYTLSSYFMARIVGDLPMELILPALSLTITYWMAGLKPDLGAFLLSLFVVLGYVLVSGGLGLAFGATIMDAKQASTMVTVTMLAFILVGGLYVHKVPSGVAWIKYISTTFYCYRLLISVQYGQGLGVWSMLDCSRHENNNYNNQGSCRFIEDDIKGQMHPTMCICILLIMLVGYRLLAYIALRRIKA